jgi:hypothetical protein
MSINSRLMQRAQELQRTGRHADARTVLDTVLAAEPGNKAAWELRLAVSDTPDDREQVLRACLQQHPDAVEWWEQLVTLKTMEAPEPPLPHRYRRLYFVAAVLALLLAVAALFFVSHNPLQAEVDRLTLDQRNLTTAYNQLDRQYRSLVAQYNILHDAHTQLQRDFGQLQQQYTELNRQHAELTAQYQTLEQQRAKLAADYQALQTDFANLRAYSDQLNASYTAFRSIAVAPPYIYIHGRQVTMAFVRLDGTVERWEVPFDRLESDLERGHQMRANDNARLPTLDLRNTESGRRYTVVDFRPLVEGETFSRVIPALYQTAGSEDQFIREAWNIVAQLTVYSDEIDETPRYPLETLLAGGGDCEDTSILLASLLRAAPANWKVYLLYMDSDNPGAPQTVNHVAVYVDTGWRQYTIETTNRQDMLPYPAGVTGWYEQVQ